MTCFRIFLSSLFHGSSLTYLTVFVSALYVEVSLSFSLSHGGVEGLTQVREGSPKFYENVAVTRDL